MNEVAGGACAAAVLGAIAGSFLSTLAIRWPEHRSIVQGRSACDGCGITIGAWRLVPIVSYLWARGRCWCCGAPIYRTHPMMEVGCTLIGAAALLVQPGPAGWCGAMFGWLLATLALLDHEHFWLPDRLTLPLAALGLLAGAIGVPPALPDRLIGAIAGWLALALLARGYRAARGRVGLGQGDAKLLGAIGAWLGWAALPWVVIAACAIGFAVALIRKMRGTDRLPLGALLACAAWPAWLLLQRAG
ncbi:prepilin peptidase [Sphingomonas bacterium]|uniref:prepilin peptidase n=1 Tax=Sphingomonas bacterium TaxID=1895847 RepID=UPI0015758BB1|nr:A24 family peptidase [Sphingomonas bacterium]